MVFAHYERELAGWLELGGAACERRFTQGAAYVNVGACDGMLRLTALLGTVHGDCPPMELILSYPTSRRTRSTSPSTRSPASPVYRSWPSDRARSS